MKTLLAIITSLILTVNVSSQNTDRESIVSVLDSMVQEDQKWRGLLRQLYNEEIDSIDEKTISQNLGRTDSLNYEVLLNIFNQQGFLGSTEIGSNGTHNYWLLVQHQDKHPDFQLRVLSQMKLHAEKGSMSYLDYAYLIDRVKINTNQLQVYGTQMSLNIDSSSYIPKPVIEPEKLNERRTSIGLPTIEDYIETMNKRYIGTLKK
jgi:hypothetical protein